MSESILKLVAAVLLLVSCYLPLGQTVPIGRQDRLDSTNSSQQNQSVATTSGQRGSPINLKDPVLTSYPPFKFDNYNTPIPSMTLANNGHTLLLSLPKKYPTDQTPAISGGGLNGTYNFVQLHFHWGSSLKKGGSEHLINSKRYAAEMHLVHYNTKYSSFAEATSYPDGLAVLGVMLHPQSVRGHKGFSEITKTVVAPPSLIKAGAEGSLPSPLSLINLLPLKLNTFYRYDGSLTTPKFAEIVTWTVFDSPIIVSANQIGVLNQLQNDEGEALTNNYREVQPLNGRKIRYNYKSYF